MIKETLTYSRYEIEETRKSRIDPSMEIRVTVGLKCPKCRNRLKTIEHGCMEICDQCGLNMTRYGNALECELEEDRPSAFFRKIISAGQ